LAFIIILIGLSYIGAFLDFLTILITGNNMEFPYIGVTLGYMCLAPLTILAMYVAAELLIPEKKHLIIYITIIYLVIGIVYVLFLFLDIRGSITVVNPSKSGVDIIAVRFNIGSPLFLILSFLILSILIFNGFGSLYKSFHETGIIRKKFSFLAFGTFFLLGVTINNMFFLNIFSVIILLVGNLLGFWFYYMGLREEPEKKIEFEPKKEVKVKSNLFRVSKFKREDITEEEVSISKEKKICLVCKGKAFRFSTYLCPGCEAFYCAKCAQALIELENACWVCDAPIDESKPVKPFKRDDEIEVEVSEKPQKKPKTKK
jgi:hypothetical protein